MSSFWDELKLRGYAAIVDLPGTAESQHLEFKRKATPDRGGLSDDDRKGIAETLSGMSNADGGVILFGIEDEKSDDIDVAKRAQDLADVELLANRVRSLCDNLLDPPNRDIDVLPLVRPGSDSGVIAIRVGRSDGRPHMSTAKSHQRFYLRVFGANMPMASYQIRDMLRIATVPQLGLSYQFEAYISSTGRESLSITVLVVNNGRVSAKQPYLVVSTTPLAHWINPIEQSFRRFALADPHTLAFRSVDGHSIHPGMSVPAARVIAKLARNADSETMLSFSSTGSTKAMDAAMELRISVGCEDTPATDYKVTLRGSELENAADAAILGQRHTLVAMGVSHFVRSDSHQ